MVAFVFFVEKLKSEGFSSLFSPRKRVFGKRTSTVVEFTGKGVSDIKAHLDYCHEGAKKGKTLYMELLNAP